MTDDHDDGQGDAPDTIDDRLADIAHLIDALVDEQDDARRLLHRAVIVRLLARLGADTLDRIAALLDRLERDHVTLTIRPRGDWQNPAQPVVGPRMVLSTVTMLPAHYTAANMVPSDTAAYLRSIQNDYTVNRGYSIGYNFAVDRAGVAWECRGFDIKCAANKGMNEVTIAVLCLVNGADAMNPAMVDTFRQLGAEAQRRITAALLVVGHRDIGSTACPGDGIYHQVVTGQLEPATTPVPKPEPPTPTPPAEDDDMAFIIINRDTGQPALVYGDGKVTGIDGGSFDAFAAKYGPAITVEAVTFADFANKE